MKRTARPAAAGEALHCESAGTMDEGGAPRQTAREQVRHLRHPVIRDREEADLGPNLVLRVREVEPKPSRVSPGSLRVRRDVNDVPARNERSGEASAQPPQADEQNP